MKDASGAPQLAVLGVDIVDESLFALAERTPGLERVYFLLEKEMTASRYEVHGLGLEDVVREREKAGDPTRQKCRRPSSPGCRRRAPGLHHPPRHFHQPVQQMYGA